MTPSDGWLIAPTNGQASSADARWREQSIPTRISTGNIGSAMFTTANTGWAAQDNQLSKTSDGGDSWVRVHDFSDEGCERIEAIAGVGAGDPPARRMP